MSKKVSLKDIAKEVGVSTALVSYVLNNLKEGRISKDVAQRIRDVAKKLNYRPNQIAKSLKTRKTHTIGLIVADISNPFSSSLARFVEDEAAKYNYTVIFGSSDENAQKFERVLDTLMNRQVDGLILSPPGGSESQIADLVKQDVPLVLLDRYFPSVQASYVVLNNHAAAAAATTHLANTGCTRIGMITYKSELVHLHDRFEGYLSALTENKLPYNERLVKFVDIIDNKHQIESAVRELLKPGNQVDGLLFASNIIAGHALRLINNLPVRVPDDLAIVSFDETESLDLFYAPLTYIRQPLREMAAKAVEILMENIVHPPKNTQVELSADLVVRQSTEEKRPV